MMMAGGNGNKEREERENWRKGKGKGRVGGKREGCKLVKYLETQDTHFIGIQNGSTLSIAKFPIICI